MPTPSLSATPDLRLLVHFGAGLTVSASDFTAGFELPSHTMTHQSKPPFSVDIQAIQETVTDEIDLIALWSIGITSGHQGDYQCMQTLESKGLCSGR